MKKAVISTGGKQYLVGLNEELEVGLLPAAKTVDFDALLIIDDAKVEIGTPSLDGHKVTAQVIDQLVKAEKVTAIRYKAKKRVNKRRGHRQRLTRIKITDIK